MKPKTDKSKLAKTKEQEFYRFAEALIAVSKKELDKEIAKDERKKATKNVSKRS